MRFNAVIVDPYTNSATANVMFADPDTNPDEPSVLLFSRPIEPGFEDSSYYFEINDQSNGNYGGLEAVTLTRYGLNVLLSEKVVAKFGNTNFREIQVDFDISDKVYQSVSEMLHRIFKGYDIFEVQ